jgi:hypothetical protein
MGAKGQPKTPGSGRRKGVKNKDSLPLQEKARELGVDPFGILLLFAKNDWSALGYESQKITVFSKHYEPVEVDVISPDLRLRAAAEAAQYLYPKLKTIEAKVTSDPKEPIHIRISYEDDDLSYQDGEENSPTEKNQ